MRRLWMFVSLVAVFGMTSCMDTYYVTQRTTFDAAIKSVQAQMADQGYYLNGSSTNTRNETVVTGVSYTRHSGYGTAMANNFITQDTYRFADSLENTMNYSISYQAKQTNEGTQFVENVEVCGCETSNPNDYEKFCLQETEVKQLNNLPKDQKIRKLNVTNTILAATGIILAITLIIFSFSKTL